MDQRLADGRAGWLFALRRTYIDWFTAGLEHVLGVKDAYMPYRFTDLTARFDYRLTDDVALEASVLQESDELTGPVPDVIHQTRIDWGNLAVRTTVDMPFRGHRLRHTAGYTGYAVDSDTTGFEESTDGLNAPRAASIEHAVSQPDGIVTIQFEERADVMGEVVTDDAGAELLVLPPDGFRARNSAGDTWSFRFRVPLGVRVEIQVAGETVARIEPPGAREVEIRLGER